MKKYAGYQIYSPFTAQICAALGGGIRVYLLFNFVLMHNNIFVKSNHQQKKKKKCNEIEQFVTRSEKSENLKIKA